MVTEKEINAAKEQLKTATIACSDVGMQLANAKATLEIEKAKGFASGSIEGKNAELREAAARELLSDLYTNVDNLSVAYDKARLDLDLARIEDSRIGMLLRLQEAT